MTLLESYKKRLAVSESVYAKEHAGEKMGQHKQLMIAKLLDNTNKFLTEAFDSSIGTQRSDMGMFKKFALNLVTVALPNLIAPELVITYPMSSMSGYVNYIEYVAGVDKGAVAEGQMFNSPFALGNYDSQYTSSKVSVTATGSIPAIAWTPVVPGTVEIVVGNVTYVDNGAGAFISTTKGDGTVISKRLVTVVGEDGRYSGVPAKVEVVATDADGDAVTPTGTINYTTGAITGITANTGDAVSVEYQYNNVVVPQNSLPTIKAEMKSMPLLAKARRIAVFYSQMAAFQAKTDYGFDLGDSLAEQAVGQLAYEIDTEVVQLLAENADANADLVWSRTLPIGVSKAEHYEGFVEVLQIAKSIVYKATKKFMPNYMIIAPDVLRVLPFIKSWKGADPKVTNGPYFAGTLEGVKVFVSPSFDEGEYVIGVNGSDMMSSAAVYAPYMPIVPTQLLQYADGGTSQGWSTLYDLKLLNKSLLVKGKVTA